jgi:hypothetical protein
MIPWLQDGILIAGEIFFELDKLLSLLSSFFLNELREVFLKLLDSLWISGHLSLQCILGIA